MKKLNKKEILVLARLLTNEIYDAKSRESYEIEMENYELAREAEEYRKTLEKIYKKI